MHVHFLTDEPNKIPKMRALLEPQHCVDPTIVGSNDIRVRHDGVVMVDADLRRPERIEQIRKDLLALTRNPRKAVRGREEHARDGRSGPGAGRNGYRVPPDGNRAARSTGSK